MTTATLASPQRDGVVIGLVGCAHFFSHFFQLALASMFPVLQPDLGVSYTELGLLMTVFYTVSGTLQAFAGIVVDRYGGNRLILFGVSTMAIATGAMAFADSYWTLMALIVVSAIGNSIFHPADLSILSLKVSKQRLGRGYSVHQLSGTLGYATSPAIGLSIAVAYDWRTALMVLAALGLIAVVILTLAQPMLDTRERRPQTTAASEAASFFQLFGNTAIFLGFGYFLFTAGAGKAMDTLGIAAFDQIYHEPVQTLAFGVTAYLLGGAAGIIAGGILADRTDRHDRVAVTGLVIAACLIAPVATGLVPFALTLVLCAATGFAGGATGPSRDLLIRAAAPKGATGKVFGLVYCGLDAGSALSPFLFGLFLDAKLPGAIFLGMAVLYGLAITTAIAVSRRGRVEPAVA